MRLFFLLTIFAAPLMGKPLQVEVSAPSALLMNAETGAVLYGKNIHEKNHPASITKIVTALYILEKKSHLLPGTMKVSPYAMTSVPAYVRQAANSPHPSYTLEHDGTMMRLVPGEVVPVKALMHGLLLQSGNDAANVLGEAACGSMDQFIGEMQQFIEEKGMKETHFSNPHGLHREDHWTTAYDMACITRLALKNPLFREIVKSTKYLCPQTNKQPSRYLYQNNKLLKPGPYFYPKAIGVKTGYVAKAGFTFVGAASHEGRELIAVLLNCDESAHRFRDSIKMFEAAFAEKPVSRLLFAKGSDQFSVEAKGAKSLVVGRLKEDVVLTYYPAEEPSFRAEIEWTGCQLPIKAEAPIGILRLIAEEGKIISQLPVYAERDVQKTWWFAFSCFCTSYKMGLIGLFLGSQIILFLLYFLKKNQKIGQR